ncbi:MAG TPA: sulfotransferase [Deltaproteobacteria bacterium]|nr:sulfotransferase [Candidatus Binatota bacterium]HIL12766.1 sulfotransferase [Deltaproteobacteria bacterium]
MSSTSKTLAEHYTRPDWVRRINAMGDSVAGARRLIPLDADALINDAVESTGGLSDFGSYDGDWQARFTSLLEELESTGALNTMGRLMTRQEVLRGLRTRLFLTRARSETPAMADENIDAPLVITGPPRSGTSILFELLSLDPTARAPLAWEVIHPLAFDRANEQARVAMAECEQEFWADVQPEFAAIHELRADLPVECVTLTLPGFSGGHWSMIADVPNWDADYPATMRYHRALLQALQHGGPPRNWVLKTPLYLAFIDMLLDAYPDARVVHTHRDPLKTEPSAFSTLATVRWQRSDEVGMPDPDGVGLGDMMVDLARRRSEGEFADSIVDLHFSQLMADPAGAVEELYSQLDRPFASPHADAIRAYMKAKPKGKFGQHKYSAEQWGFDPARIRKKMLPYTDYYGVTLEG